MTHKIYFDGGSALKMICIYDEDRKESFTDKFEDKLTNNELEYKALWKAVSYANAYYGNISAVTFLGDSELIIKQMKGEYKVKRLNLRKLRNNIVEEITQKGINDFRNHFIWVPRESNNAGIILEGILKKVKAEKYHD